MVVPTYKDYYDIPGGYVEHGETPYEAAQREVFEELGIKPPIGRLLVADWWQDSPEAHGVPKLLLVFDGGQLGDCDVGSIDIDESEVAEARYEEPANLDSVTIPRLANRLRKALGARRGSFVQYLENGTTTGPTA